MNRKVVDDIKNYFESYELMDKLIDHSKEMPAIKIIIYHNEKQQTLNIQVLERIVRGKAQRRKLLMTGFNAGDNLFCEFRLSYTKAKFTFRLNQEKVELVRKEILPLVKRYKCTHYGTTVTVELYNPRLQEIMDIFTTFEPVCRRVME